MPKFYVESGPAQCVIEAVDAEDAAIQAFQWSCDSRNRVLASDWAEPGEAADAQDWELGAEVRVSEQGFGRADARVFDTLQIVAVWQGYAVPWC